MRSTIKVAALAAFAVSTVAVPLAFAGPDEAGENSFWTHQSVTEAPTQAAPTTTARGHSNERYRATYAQPTERAPAAQAQKDPQYFYHAMGTMGGQ